jgi:hypothetical protein
MDEQKVKTCEDFIHIWHRVLGVSVQSWNKTITQRPKNFYLQKLRITTMLSIFWQTGCDPQTTCAWRKESKQWILCTRAGRVNKVDSDRATTILKERFLSHECSCLFCHDNHMILGELLHGVDRLPTLFTWCLTLRSPLITKYQSFLSYLHTSPILYNKPV